MKPPTVLALYQYYSGQLLKKLQGKSAHIWMSPNVFRGISLPFLMEISWEKGREGRERRRLYLNSPTPRKYLPISRRKRMDLAHYDIVMLLLL